MPNRRTYLTHLDEAELPAIVRVSDNLFAAVFVLLKLTLARHLIRQAKERGLLVAGGHIIESTSGTMGLGLAYACREFACRLTVVGDPVIDEGLRLKLEALGAHVNIVETPLPEGGMQGARLQKLHELLAQTPGAFWTQQYDNPDAPHAYYRAAQRIAGSVGPVDFLVAPVASGSSSAGLTRGLQAAGHAARLIAVDTHHSVLFGHTDGKRLLRGLGNSIHPKNMDYSLTEQCHWVSAAEAFKATRELFSAHLLDAGPTSGATYMVARWIARRYPRKKVVFVCADTGERYRLTVYNPRWLASNNVLIDRTPRRPRLVTRPADAGEGWSYMEWAGRPLSDVLPERS